MHDDVLAATREATGAAEQLAAHLERLSVRLRPVFPLLAADLGTWDDEGRERLHAFLRMFEQLYDLASRKLLRGFLILSSEDVGSLSVRNQFRRAEALGFLDNAQRWMELGQTRNLLVHDYPTKAADQAENANKAWGDLPTLISAVRRGLDALQAEGWLK